MTVSLRLCYIPPVGSVAQLAEQGTHNLASEAVKLTKQFIESRREGLSPNTIEHYNGYLKRATQVIGLNISGLDITLFLKSLKCSSGGKHSYFRVLRTFYNWLYSRKSGYKLN